LLITGSTTSADITVIDDFGNQIRLAKPAERIVTLAPHLTELLFQLELGDRLVGVVEFSDFPLAANRIERVGNAFAVSVEKIVELQPDLIVAWGSGGSREQLRKLRSLGFPVYYSEPKRLTDVPESIHRIALLAGKGPVGVRVKDEFNSRLEQIKQSANGRTSPRVFFQISSTDLYTVNDRHLIGQAISLCGGINIFGTLDVPVPRVSNEAILVGQPEVIIRSSVDTEKDDWRERWSGTRQIPAVGAGQLYEIPADLISRPGFRMLEGIDRLCDIISEVADVAAG
jgi:iron complex transport system substrate-binding protein